MAVHRRAADDSEALGGQRLQPQLIAAAGDRTLDACGEQPFEQLEQEVLHRYRQRQHPIEEGVDAGQFVLEAAIAVEQ